MQKCSTKPIKKGAKKPACYTTLSAEDGTNQSDFGHQDDFSYGGWAYEKAGRILKALPVLIREFMVGN